MYHHDLSESHWTSLPAICQVIALHEFKAAACSSLVIFSGYNTTVRTTRLQDPSEFHF